MRSPDGIDPFSPEFKEALLRDARFDFPNFYRAATDDDAMLMDSLVLAHAAVVSTANIPRENLEPHVRDALERAGDMIDQLFSALRQRVRECSTFAGLPAAERAHVERVALEPKFPDCA